MVIPFCKRPFEYFPDVLGPKLLVVDVHRHLLLSYGRFQILPFCAAVSHDLCQLIRQHQLVHLIPQPVSIPSDDPPDHPHSPTLRIRPSSRLRNLPQGRRYARISEHILALSTPSSWAYHGTAGHSLVSLDWISFPFYVVIRSAHTFSNPRACFAWEHHPLYGPTPSRLSSSLRMSLPRFPPGRFHTLHPRRTDTPHQHIFSTLARRPLSPDRSHHEGPYHIPSISRTLVDNRFSSGSFLLLIVLNLSSPVRLYLQYIRLQTQPPTASNEASKPCPSVGPFHKPAGRRHRLFSSPRQAFCRTPSLATLHVSHERLRKIPHTRCFCLFFTPLPLPPLFPARSDAACSAAKAAEPLSTTTPP